MPSVAPLRRFRARVAEGVVVPLFIETLGREEVLLDLSQFFRAEGFNVGFATVVVAARLNFLLCPGLYFVEVLFA